MDAMNVEVNVDYELIIGERKKKEIWTNSKPMIKQEMPKQLTLPYRPQRTLN